MWRSIKNARQLEKGKSVSEVTARIEETIHIYTTQGDVENAIMQMCKKRFLLTSNTPLMNGSSLSNQLGYLGNSDTAQEIVQGSYEAPLETDKVTSELLDLISKFHRKFYQPMVSVDVTTNAYKRFWRSSKEKQAHHSHVYISDTTKLVSLVTT